MKLERKQDILEYLIKYYDEPDKIAFYTILQIRGSMKKRGTIHAEQNHSSIDAHCNNHIMDPCEQVKELIKRHANIMAAKHHSDSRYHVKCTGQAMRLTQSDVFTEMKKSAISLLSSHGMEMFIQECSQIKMYEFRHSTSQDGTMKKSVVKRKGKDWSHAREIEGNCRCTCYNCVGFDIQCVHELLADGHFIIEKWGSRHLNEFSYSTIVGYPHMAAEATSQVMTNFKESNDKKDDDMECSQTPYEDDMDCSRTPCDESDIECEEDSATNSGKTGFKVTYQMLHSLFAEVANMCKTQVSAQGLFATLESIKSFMSNQAITVDSTKRGFEEVFDFSKEVFLRNMITNTQSNTHLTFISHTGGRPKQKRLISGVETRLFSKHKQGHKNQKTCSFCNESSHRITTCQVRKSWGTSLNCQEEMARYVAEMCSVTSTVLISHCFEHNDKVVKVLNSIPKQAHFISLRKKFLVPGTQTAQSERDLCMEVIYLRQGGVPIEECSPCFVYVAFVRCWIYQNKQRFQRVLVQNSPGSYTQTSPMSGQRYSQMSPMSGYALKGTPSSFASPNNPQHMYPIILPNALNLSQCLHAAQNHSPNVGSRVLEVSTPVQKSDQNGYD